jgi:hypothetical protein
MESPGTPPPPSCPLEQYTVQKIAAAVEGLIHLSPAYGDYAKKVVEQGIDGLTLVDLLESPNADNVINQLLLELGVSLLGHRTRLKRLFNDLHPRAAAADRFQSPAHELDAPERVLWLKGCLILEACAKGVKPFVGRVMERLHKRIMENVKSDIMRDLGACEDEEWNCSACGDADADDAPVALAIRTMDSNGIMDCGVAHKLKSFELKPCHHSNIDAFCFPDCDCAMLPLFMCPNPADISKPESSTFLLLHRSQPTLTVPPWTPFLVTCCEPSSNPPLTFHAVFGCSYPGYTAKQVKQVQLQQLRNTTKPPEFSLAFWSLKRHESEFEEWRHGLKSGRMLRFDNAEGSCLPDGIKPGCRYLVTVAMDFSFNVCGPILTPILPLPLTPESYPVGNTPLVVMRKSPLGR